MKDIKKKKPFIITFIFLGGIILLASFISIPPREVKVDRLSDKFNNLFLKDSVLQTIKESSVRRQEVDKAIAQYDQQTDYMHRNLTYAIRELMWEEKELLKSTLATWQQSETWETDSTTIVNNLDNQQALSNQIEKSLLKLN